MKGSLIPCPTCGSLGFVVDVRASRVDEAMQVRRRYECLKEDCAERWTTFERREDTSRDGRGPTSDYDKLSITDKAQINRMLGSKLMWIAQKLRKNQLK